MWKYVKYKYIQWLIYSGQIDEHRWKDYWYSWSPGDKTVQLFVRDNFSGREINNPIRWDTVDVVALQIWESLDDDEKAKVMAGVLGG